MLATIQPEKEHITIFIPPGSFDVSTDELLQFDSCRRVFEDQLKKLDNCAKSEAFQPIVKWMRKVVERMAPELLFDEE